MAETIRMAQEKWDAEKPRTMLTLFEIYHTIRHQNLKTILF